MRTNSHVMRPTRLSYAVSLALASLVAGNLAMAQEAPQPNPNPNPNATPGANVSQGGQIAQVLVSTRRSQQSSIERKKNAATAMDSIVAEDVGSLPDRNIGEAISRMAGVSLERGDFGEGVNVAVRGNGPELTRVELDGQAVLSAGGADMNGGGSGRGTEFRQLSADLIKSVDVVKGSTADMTEGSLGGGIIIKTRTGLDFAKPFASLRVSGQQSSLNKKWTPDTNLILSDKFMNNRLGVLVNASSTTMRNEMHSMQVAASANQGYARLLDFDKSPEKTWVANPNTLNMADPVSTTPTGTAGTFKGATPLEILTKSAAAKTKADCYTAFPILTETSPALANISTRASDKGAAANIRGNELMSCLNQWNDYTPSLIRNLIRREIDKRQNLDLRADFKVNNELTVYAKGSYNKRKVDNNSLTYSLGGLNVNTAGKFTDTTTGVRTANPGSGYYNYDIPSWRSGTYPSTGTVANVDPSTVKVDSTHHVTQYTITDGVANTDQIHMRSQTDTRYLQLGGSFKRGGLLAEFFVGDSESKFQRGDARTAFNYNYGAATMSVLPTGLWTYTFPAGTNFDQANPANYSATKPATDPIRAVTTATAFIPKSPAYTIAQQPLTTQAAQATWTPRIYETGERTAKLDLSYATPESIPFFKRFKAGFNLRDTTANQWGTNGGYVAKTGVGNIGDANYVAPVAVPRSIIRSFLQGCENTPTSANSPVGCKLGFKPNADPRNGTEGTMFVTPQQFQDIIAQSLTGKATDTKFFNGAKGRADNMIDNWTQIDVDKFMALSGVPGLNYDCVKTCTGTDGNVYEQPVTRLKERTQAVYLMGDFGLDHVPFTGWTFPFGWEIEGNMGYRYVRTQVHGTGQMTFTSVTPSASFDPANPTAAGGTVSSSLTQNTAVQQTTHDFLPIYNLAMWVVPDKVVVRYNHAKTVARPSVGQLMPSGTCTYNATFVDDDQRCTGTVGNPALLAQRNVNQNLSVEYYPNKDTMFTIAAFEQKGIVGPAITQGVSQVPFFAGSSQVDPVTQKPLSSILFDYTTYLNGAATSRKGLEFSTKTAFTFLPWLFRYTGFDGNYSKLRSATSSQNIVELLSGDPLPPARESKFSYNWALWYDDGRLSARVAVQAVASYFSCIAQCGLTGANNWPNVAGGRTTVIPYNPGFPNYKDSTRYIDAKIAYKITPNIEVFAEGRNLGNNTSTNSQGSYGTFEDGTRSLLDYAYSGRRIMAGANFRFGG